MPPGGSKVEAMSPSRAPTGRQWRLEGGPYAAVVVESGGGLRELTHGDTPVLAGYPEDQMPAGGRGQVLAPWPNRVRSGAWTHHGRKLQLPVTEVGRHNANHGLVRWVAWHELGSGPSWVRLGCRLMAQSGFPWPLDLTVHYALSEQGLEVTVGAANPGPEPVPFAAGMHPYLALSGPLADTVLQVPARTRLLVDDQAIPIGEEPVAGSAYDFAEGRAVGDATVDDCFGDLVRGEDGTAVCRVGAAPGSGPVVELWVDRAWRWLQVYTGDDLSPGTPGTGPRESVAVEPMSAPPDALNSGRDLAVLEPGGEWSGTWGVRRTDG